MLQLSWKYFLQHFTDKLVCPESNAVSSNVAPPISDLQYGSGVQFLFGSLNVVLVCSLNFYVLFLQFTPTVQKKKNKQTDWTIKIVC